MERNLNLSPAARSLFATRTLMFNEFLRLGGKEEGFDIYNAILGEKYEQTLENQIASLNATRELYNQTVYDKIVSAYSNIDTFNSLKSNDRRTFFDRQAQTEAYEKLKTQMISSMKLIQETGDKIRNSKLKFELIIGPKDSKTVLGAYTLTGEQMGQVAADNNLFTAYTKNNRITSSTNMDFFLRVQGDLLNPAIDQSLISKIQAVQGVRDTDLEQIWPIARQNSIINDQLNKELRNGNYAEVIYKYSQGIISSIPKSVPTVDRVPANIQGDVNQWTSDHSYLDMTQVKSFFGTDQGFTITTTSFLANSLQAQLDLIRQPLFNIDQQSQYVMNNALDELDDSTKQAFIESAQSYFQSHFLET